MIDENTSEVKIIWNKFDYDMDFERDDNNFFWNKKLLVITNDFTLEFCNIDEGQWSINPREILYYIPFNWITLPLEIKTLKKEKEIEYLKKKYGKDNVEINGDQITIIYHKTAKGDKIITDEYKDII